MLKRFKKHKLGIVSAIILAFMIIVTLFAEFFAPYGNNEMVGPTHAPPRQVHFFDAKGNFHMRPFVYPVEKDFDFATGIVNFKADKSRRIPLKFFTKGATYRLFGLFKSDLHLFDLSDTETTLYLLGTDLIGRDLFSRILYGGRISLLVGFLGVFICLLIAVPLGLLSGYMGGILDIIIQRLVEVFRVIPYIPLALALAAFLPPNLPPMQMILGVIIVLILPKWSDLARQIRGKTLAIREEGYVEGAKAAGAGTLRIMFKHILPNVLSHIIVVGTVTLPLIILAESGLSFLGFGIKPPMTSWGMLLRQAQQLSTLQLYWWKAIPGLFIIITVLSLNFVGDGIRDAADPYQK